MKWVESLPVTLLWDPETSSACRCCTMRVKGGVFIKVNKSGLVESLCSGCYEAIRLHARNDFKFVPLEELKRDRKRVFSMPAWLVKERSALRYFIPKDQIDLGLLILKAKRGGKP